jgi:GntR family transcriptional regulator, rspAB operon transcriptional repressor
MRLGDVVPEADPKSRLTSRELVARELRAEITHGDLVPGTKLNPAGLAERFGVSQTPAREAIQLLASEGLIRIDPYRGARVSELTLEEYEELFLMRVGIESLAARLGAERIDDEGVAEMQRLFGEMEAAAAADDIDLFYERDRRFHFTHYAATGRESLVRRIMQLRMATERYVRRAYVTPRVSMKDTLETHRALLAAVELRDGQRCEEVLKADLRRTLETFAEHFATTGQSLAAADVG